MSIFIAELSAILLALRTFYPLLVKVCYIYSDSTAAFSSLDIYYHCCPLVLGIHKWFLLWRIRGHYIIFLMGAFLCLYRGKERTYKVASAAALRRAHACP